VLEVLPGGGLFRENIVHAPDRLDLHLLISIVIG